MISKLAGPKDFWIGLIYLGFGALALYFGCALAAWKLRADGVTTDGQAPFRVPFAAIIPWVTCLVILWLLTGLARDEWLAFGVCLAVGSLAYLARSRRTAAA